VCDDYATSSCRAVDECDGGSMYGCARVKKTSGNVHCTGPDSPYTTWHFLLVFSMTRA
jgi:hypothetical protein